VARPKIPELLKQQLLYDSQYACVVCQARGSHIHHIDRDNSNNVDSNLVVLCMTHHDDAHTQRELSRNLDPASLRAAKKKWLVQVDAKRTVTATEAGQKEAAGEFFAVGVTWGYINHARVAQLAKPALLSGPDLEYFSYCRDRSLIDMHGILIKPASYQPGSSFLSCSVYDWFDHGDDSRVHHLYASLVDQVSRAVRPIHFGPHNWSKESLLGLLKPGDFIFVRQSFQFRTVERTSDNEHRRGEYSAKGITLEFFVDTRDMFGTTSMTVSFTGRQTCAALVQIKSIDLAQDGKLHLAATPIALGVSFSPER
jgi:hypothetical protein